MSLHVDRDRTRPTIPVCKVVGGRSNDSGVAMSTVQAVRPPNTVALFSGHMIDAPDRKIPRFPPDKEPAAAAAITDTLSKIGVIPGDLAICGGACGGDLLFAEACLARDMRLEI